MPFMQRRRNNRSRKVLDLPSVTPDAEGRMNKGDFDHYTRTIQEWSRDVAEGISEHGVVAHRFFETNSSIFTGTNFTDMVLANVPVRQGLFYGVHVNSPIEVSGTPAGSRWLANVVVGNVQIGRVGEIDGDIQNFVDGWAWHVPAADTVTNVVVTLTEIVGAGDVQLAAAAGSPRSITLIAFGPAPIAFP